MQITSNMSPSEQHKILKTWNYHNTISTWAATNNDKPSVNLIIIDLDHYSYWLTNHLFIKAGKHSSQSGDTSYTYMNSMLFPAKDFLKMFPMKQRYSGKNPSQNKGFLITVAWCPCYLKQWTVGCLPVDSSLANLPGGGSLPVLWLAVASRESNLNMVHSRLLRKISSINSMFTTGLETNVMFF